MELYLLRHGIAADAKHGQSDYNRELTREGIEKLTRVLESARDAGAAPTLILSSPYIRARQTADLAQQILNVPQPIQFSEAFTPDAGPEKAWDEIRLYDHEPSILIASHNPLCSYLLPYLLQSPEMLVDYKKGALAALHIDPVAKQPHAKLRYLLIAKIIQP